MKRLLSFLAAIVLLGFQSLQAQWIQTNGPYGGTVYSFAVSGSNLFAGTWGGGVFLSTDNGASWAQVNTGLTNTDILSLVVNGSNLFAGTDGGGVWRCPLSEMVTGVDEHFTQIPNAFVLEQNYPNPFNPATTITYQLPQSADVSIKIYDLLGHSLRTLVNENKTLGNYSVIWDGKDDRGQMVPSGIYIYRIHAQYFEKANKMMLIR